MSARILAVVVLVAVVLGGCDLLPADLRPKVAEAQAVSLAREAIAAQGMHGADEEVLQARQLTYEEVADDFAEPIEGPRPQPDDCVWFIDIGSNPGPLMGQGVRVTLDCFDGHIIHVTPWIS